ncbi:hypothetical protein [Streptomyces misionensis]
MDRASWGREPEGGKGAGQAVEAEAPPAPPATAQPVADLVD